MAADQTFTFADSEFTDVPEGFSVLQPAGDTGGVFVLTSDEPISNVGIGSDPINTSVQVLASVENFQIDLNVGDDRLLIGGDATDATIELGAGRDNLVVKGDFINSGVDSGAGPDVLRFEGAVSNSYINSGADDDLVGFLGNVNGSNIQLGTGNDQVRFYGDATNTLLNLGGGTDVVRFFENNPNTTGLVIEGADADDVLFIGSSQYSFQGAYTWQNIAHPNDELRFGP